MSRLHRYLIVMAGGRGLRLGAPVPKQFLILAGRPVIFHAINKFIKYDPGLELVIVLPEESKGLWKELCMQYAFTRDHNIVAGGEERYNSVKNSMSLIRQKSLVAVHDAVRPLVSKATIDRCFTMAAEKGNAVPFIQPRESVREIISDAGNRPLKREKIALIQTPQIFRSDILLAAYARPYEPSFTDDATVVEAAGHKINLVPGNPENIKITTKEDLILAEAMLKSSYEG